MKRTLILLLAVIVFSCNDEDKTNSDQAELINFKVSATENFSPVKTVIESEEGIIQVFNESDFNVSDFPVTLTPEIEVSAGATISPASAP